MDLIERIVIRISHRMKIRNPRNGDVQLESLKISGNTNWRKKNGKIKW